MSSMMDAFGKGELKGHFSQDAKWDTRFLELAQHVSTWSKDPTTKCGAVITDGKFIVSTGYNGFPVGTKDWQVLYEDREEKYLRVVHAELNAILRARQKLTGCTLYVWPMPPCSQCAAAIIQTGIARVVSIKPTKEQAERWGDGFKSALSMFQDASVELVLKEMKR